MVVSSDKPLSQLAIRLCDLRPDGTSALITHGFINLTMVESFEEPKLLEPGKKVNVKVLLDQIAYYLPEGHRIRVAVSSSYWPFIWPSPERPEIKLFSGSIQLPQTESIMMDIKTDFGFLSVFSTPPFLWTLPHAP